jgi:DNA-binding GntR family transcriptional regulator
MSFADRDALAKIHYDSESCVPDENFDTYDVANRNFHEAIYAGSANVYLEDSIKEIRSRLRVYRKYPFQRPGEIRRSYKDHGEVLAGITRGDPDAAAAAMRIHIQNGMQAFVDLMADRRRHIPGS